MGQNHSENVKLALFNMFHGAPTDDPDPTEQELDIAKREAFVVAEGRGYDAIQRTRVRDAVSFVELP